MILFSTIPVTKTQLNIISFWSQSPLALGQDEDKNPIFVISAQTGPKNRNTLKKKLHILSLICYSLFLLCNGLWHLQSPRLSTEEKFLVALFSFCVPCAVFAVTTSWYNNPEDFAILLNMILIYERKVFYSKRKNYDKIICYGRFLKLALQLLGLCGSVVIQIFLVLVIVVTAGRPPFLGSVIPGS